MASEKDRKMEKLVLALANSLIFRRAEPRFQ